MVNALIGTVSSALLLLWPSEGSLWCRLACLAARCVCSELHPAATEEADIGVGYDQAGFPSGLSRQSVTHMRSLRSLSLRSELLRFFFSKAHTAGFNPGTAIGCRTKPSKGGVAMALREMDAMFECHGLCSR